MAHDVLGNILTETKDVSVTSYAQKVIRAWTGNNDGSGATLDCAAMRAAYDPLGGYLQQCYRLATYTATGQIDTLADANNNLTKYEFDALDRMTRTYFPSKTTAGQSSMLELDPDDWDYEEITYNALDQMVEKRTRRGDVIKYTNDALGRLLDRTVPGAPTHTSEGRIVSHSYTHNAWGHIDTATHDGASILYTYDSIGRVTSQTYAGGLTVAYQWDVANNLERLTWPDNFVVDYAWDANNRVVQALDGARVLADVSYDSLSRRQTVAYGNGTTVNHTWSNRGDLTGHDHSFIGASVDYDFTYNGVGQMLTKTLSNPAYGWVAPTTGTDAYLVNGLNQYTSIDGAAPIYDGNGNLTTDHQGRGFSYDAENVLRTASGLTGGTATYRYHADGSRRQKSHNGSTSHFYYMGGLGYLDEEDTAFAADQEIAEYSGAGVLQKRFVRLPGSIDEAFLMIDVSGGSPVETWAHMDRLGSVIATTDSTGVTNGTYRYSPYGKPGSEGPSGFPFRFTGQRLDAETGLYYYKARYYDPETGRFMQTDPIGYADQMNLYAYVGNDPVNGTDPTGMECATGASCKSFAGPQYTPRPAASFGFAISQTSEGASSQTDQQINEPSLQPGDKSLLMRLGERIRGDLVRSAIEHFDIEIEGAAGAFGVDSNLIRATIFEEQTHLIPLVEGFPAENVGIGRTIGLGQVTVGLGGFSREALLDPTLNVQAIATNLFLIGREPLIDPSAPITSIATRYNCGTCKSLTSYGRRVNSYYDIFSKTN